MIQVPHNGGYSPITYRQYAYAGRFWDVPKEFEFPPGVKLDTGWRMWVSGLPGYEVTGGGGDPQKAPI